MTTVVRLVDDFLDEDHHTRDSCPGTVNKHKLIPIGKQFNRRFRFFKKLKHIIYLEESTRNIWYKNSKCNAGVAAMGFSLKRLHNHPKAVSMKTYAKLFLDNPFDKVDEVNSIASDWLKRNDYELI